MAAFEQMTTDARRIEDAMRQLSRGLATAATGLSPWPVVVRGLVEAANAAAEVADTMKRDGARHANVRNNARKSHPDH